VVKLRAIKYISPQLPLGTEFVMPERDARILVALKAAEVVTHEPEPEPKKRRTYRRRTHTEAIVH
jgi:hypothetical protein